MLISKHLKLLLLALLSCQVSAFAPITQSVRYSTRYNAVEGDEAAERVTIQRSEQTLYYVPTIHDIDTGRGLTSEVVPALAMENDVGVKVKAMPRGANLCEVSIGDTNYVWENNGIAGGSGERPSSGATYYGKGTDAFPLTRGLILNGGIRFAAVCAEHGLFYDTDWPMEAIRTSPDEKSIEFTIQDTSEQRKAVRDDFSNGEYNRKDGFRPTESMTKYPVTNMTYKFKITLRAGETFVRLSMTIINDTDEPCDAEAWLPMTFPINQKSEILANQGFRWRRDEWWNGFLPNVIEWNDINNIKDDKGETHDWNKPLDWPLSGIFYDFPQKDGKYHGCTIDENGKGIVYYVPEAGYPHYTKMWGWGDPENFDRETANPLAAGRPKTEYYEPWSSGFNFAFFQTTEFKAQHVYNWEVAVIPISKGLDFDLPLEEKLKVVDKHISELEKDQDLGSIAPVTKKPIN